jgi:hypothetical protein
MTLEDLRTLEIGLELYVRESPMDGECQPIIELLLRVVRADISRMKYSEGSSRSPEDDKGKHLTL